MNEDPSLLKQLLKENHLSEDESKQIEKWFMRLRSTNDRKNINALVQILKREKTGLYVTGSSLKYLGYNDLDVLYINPELSLHGALEGALTALEQRFAVGPEGERQIIAVGGQFRQAKLSSITGGPAIDLLIPDRYYRPSPTLQIEDFEYYARAELEKGEIFPLYRGHEIEDIFSEETPTGKILFYDDMTDEPIYSD